MTAAWTAPLRIPPEDRRVPTAGYLRQVEDWREGAGKSRRGAIDAVTRIGAAVPSYVDPPSGPARKTAK